MWLQTGKDEEETNGIARRAIKFYCDFVESLGWPEKILFYSLQFSLFLAVFQFIGTLLFPG